MRQQSIAVLPPPITTTRLPIRLHVLEGHRGEPVDADVDVGGHLPAPGDLEVLALGRAGADENGIESLRPSKASRLSISLLKRASTPKPTMRSISSSSTVSGRRKEGILVRIKPAAARVLLEEGAGVAEWHQITRHRQGGRPGADQGYALAILLALVRPA